MRIIAGLFFVASALLLQGAQFRAAAVKVNITPKTQQWLMGYNDRQSTGVHDDLNHRILAIDDGSTQFYLIASDLCLFSPSVYLGVTEQLRREFGINPENVWWTVTHTHAAPEVGPPEVYKMLLAGRGNHEWNRDYAKQVTDSLIQGIKTVRQNLEPARIRIGSGISMANINRRAQDVDGHVTLGLNPDGPVDRQLGVLLVERLNGSPIAAVANYAMHGTVLGGENLLISGDAPGVVSTYVEEKIGVPMLYFNGAAGNMAPIYSVYPDPQSGHLSQFRVLLGNRILQALENLERPTDHVTLRVGEKIIETRRKDGLIWPEELRAYSRVSDNGVPLVRLPIGFLQINDTLIWSAPVELFCEIAIAVRNQSAFAHTFYFGYANGWLGYLPTKAAFEEGGYEPKTSPFTGSAEKDVLNGVISYVQGASRSAN
jgi:hypothetical protein